MTIAQLHQVLEIVKCKSFNKASENLYISQPSLSVSIRKLEEELREPLFIRNSNGVVPTSFCLELLPFIRDIVGLYEQMPLQVYGKARNYQRISISNGWLPLFLRGSWSALYGAPERGYSSGISLMSLWKRDCPWSSAVAYRSAPLRSGPFKRK